MTDGPATRFHDTARRLWRTLAGDDTALEPGTRTVVRGSRGLCPPGWTGVVRLGDAVVVEAGDADPDDLDRLLDLADPVDVAAVRRSLAPSAVLGPALLCYLPTRDALVATANTVAVAVEPTAEMADWLALLDPGEVEESGVGDLTTAVVARDGGRVVGAAGHHHWPCEVAHLGVIVDPTARGRGVGTQLGAAAAARALAAGLVPQWRAHRDNHASRAIATSIGMRVGGRQLSVDLRG